MSILKKYLLFSIVGLFLLSCSSSPKEKNDFFIIQNGIRYNIDNLYVIKLKKRVFSLASNRKDFSFVISTEPIKFLENSKAIVKLSGTMGAWDEKKALLYNGSDLLNDKDACIYYYRSFGEICNEYINKKKTFGFEKDYAYTFAEYFIEGELMDIESIQDVSIQNLKENSYYIYFFREAESLGEMAFISNIKRTKISFN